MELLQILLVPVFIGISLYVTHLGRKRLKAELRRSFETLRFTTPEGVVTGDRIRVAKVYRQGMPLAYDDVFEMSLGARQWSDSFWYCVGPGPSYFVAIPMAAVGMGRVEVQWVVRPLTMERMRAALQDDEGALESVFGSSGRLGA